MTALSSNGQAGPCMLWSVPVFPKALGSVTRQPGMLGSVWVCVCVCVCEHPRVREKEMCQRSTVADRRRSATGSRSKFLAPAQTTPQPTISVTFKDWNSIKVTVYQLCSMKGKLKAPASGGREGALTCSPPSLWLLLCCEFQGGGRKEKTGFSCDCPWWVGAGLFLWVITALSLHK